MVKDFYMIAEESIPYQITIRSSAFRVYTKERHDDYEYFNTSLTIMFTINSLRRGENSVSNLSVSYRSYFRTFCVSAGLLKAISLGLVSPDKSEMRQSSLTPIWWRPDSLMIFLGLEHMQSFSDLEW